VQRAVDLHAVIEDYQAAFCVAGARGSSKFSHLGLIASGKGHLKLQSTSFVIQAGKRKRAATWEAKWIGGTFRRRRDWLFRSVQIAARQKAIRAEIINAKGAREADN
jgi:hypothetical protein